MLGVTDAWELIRYISGALKHAMQQHIMQHIIRLPSMDRNVQQCSLVYPRSGEADQEDSRAQPTQACIRPQSPIRPDRPSRTITPESLTDRQCSQPIRESDRDGAINVIIVQADHAYQCLSVL